ncbi:Hypothetical protein SMAX5B_011443 [Scophthalmus maximus]|uniref:Uncharacterized protein n=1 Tax=Scophthalmus maximus TaxID=52904 RepID=A0A2U9BMX0_SCOMX|nr:Hypothetical protein SMAX5B_011443 [Scophthalmus maximus]
MPRSVVCFRPRMGRPIASDERHGHAAGLNDVRWPSSRGAISSGGRMASKKNTRTFFEHKEKRNLLTKDIGLCMNAISDVHEEEVTLE